MGWMGLDGVGGEKCREPRNKTMLWLTILAALEIKVFTHTHRNTDPHFVTQPRSRAHICVVLITHRKPSFSLHEETLFPANTRLSGYATSLAIISYMLQLQQ